MTGVLLLAQLGAGAALLDREFPQAEVCYLLVEARARRVVAARWEAPERAVPAGSLVKPFAALAYAATHGYRYPELECRGEREGCWLPRGHGRLGISGAIAHSCNAYFIKLAAALSVEDVAAVTLRFGLSPPPEGGEAIAGMRGAWPLAPRALVEAYLELAARRAEPGVRPVLEGLALCARSGTAQALGGGALAKTGTAWCSHARRGPGDGFALVLAPEETPRLALLVRVHGAPGSKAAEVAGRMLARLR